jgi:hypothetical protein
MSLSFINNGYFKEGLFQMGYFFCLWNIFYLAIHKVFLFSKNRETDLDIKNRIVSIMHGTLSFLLSSIFIFHFGIDFDRPIDILSTKLVGLSLGYFVYDLLACLFFGLYDSKLIIHHLLSICGFSFPFVAGKGIFAGIMGLFMAESSNFPMHFRVILKQMGLRHTKAYEIFDDMYITIYIFARGILCPIFCIMSFFSKDTPLFICLVFVAMTIQSLQFVVIMFSILKKKKKEKLERQSKGVELFWITVNPQIKTLDYYNKKSKQKIF